MGMGKIGHFGLKKNVLKIEGSALLTSSWFWYSYINREMVLHLNTNNNIKMLHQNLRRTYFLTIIFSKKKERKKERKNRKKGGKNKYYLVVFI